MLVVRKALSIKGSIMKFYLGLIVSVIAIVGIKPIDDSYNKFADSTEQSENDKAAVKRAVLDYVEGIYDVKPELIERSVSKNLTKYGFWRPESSGNYQPGSSMTFEQLKKLSATYNKDNRIPRDAPKEIHIFEVMDKMACAKLRAYWGYDYFQLVKIDGRWKIRHVVWQSPPAKSSD